MAELAPHKEQVRAYFDGVGFERWSAIYGDQELTGVRRSIRIGHARMLGYVRDWLAERFASVPAGTRALDAGCGTGLGTLLLASQGFAVTALDIAPQMVAATEQNVRRAGLADRLQFVCGDIEAVAGARYEAVICLDVLVHYPQPDFTELAQRLAALSTDTLLITYAPHEPLLAALHRIGAYFPRSQRRTEIQMIPEPVVHQIFNAAGMRVRRSVRVSKGFYHTTLLEATRS